MKMKTAPMGWNSWDCYGAAVTEDIVRRNAEFMAEHLKEYGWEYIVVVSHAVTKKIAVVRGEMLR